MPAPHLAVPHVRSPVAASAADLVLRVVVLLLHQALVGLGRVPRGEVVVLRGRGMHACVRA